jgi:alpha-amylase/alpha-mannosidase (GH57 family)
MEIKAEKILLEMTYGEFWTLVWSVKVSLENDIKTHWIRHQQNWKENEKEKLTFLKKSYSILGRIDVYDQILSLAEAEFKEFNKGKK